MSGEEKINHDGTKAPSPGLTPDEYEDKKNQALALWDALEPLLGPEFMHDVVAGRLPLGAGIKEATVIFCYALATRHIEPLKKQISELDCCLRSERENVESLLKLRQHDCAALETLARRVEELLGDAEIVTDLADWSSRWPRNENYDGKRFREMHQQLSELEARARKARPQHTDSASKAEKADGSSALPATGSAPGGDEAGAEEVGA